MLGIKAAIKRIYSSKKDCFMKHSILFAITGVSSIFSVAINEVSKQKELDPTSWGWAVAGIVFLFILGAYIIGYNVNFMHNSFDEDRNDILPEFNKTHWNTFGKVFPLLLVWTIYFVVAIIAGVFTSLMLPEVGQIALVAIIIAVSFIGIFLQFVYARYSRCFSKRGLFNITLPIKYISKTGPSLFKLWIKFIPFFILNIILGALAVGHSVFAYILTAISGYISFVVNLIYAFCIVQIYKEKVEPYEKYD